MADTPEKKVKAAVKKILDELNIYHFSPPGMGLGRAGIPDLVCCARGRFIGIECKAGKGQTTALQERELAAIRAANGVALIVRETDIPTLKDKLICLTV